MSRYDCPQHGRVHHVGGDKPPKFCPICGKKVTRVWLWPHVYVETSLIQGTAVCGILAFVFYCLVFLLAIPGIKGCNENERISDERESKRYDGMNPTWRNLFVQVKNAGSEDDLKIVQAFVKDNSLKNVPPVKPDELEDIMQFIGESRRGECGALLAPFCIYTKDNLIGDAIKTQDGRKALAESLVRATTRP